MARRRTGDDNYGGTEDYDDADGGDIGGLLGGGFTDGPPQIGSIIEPAPPAPGVISKPPAGPVPNEPPTLGIGPDESGPVGNTERGRDLRPNTPNTSGPQGGGFNLPQGVSVNEGMFNGAPPGNAMQASAMPMEPNPVAAQSQSPMFAQPESGTSRGPTRRSAQSPAIFAQSSSPNLSGRAGGLLGGGLGATGQGESSGPLNPSALFQKLIQMFQQG